MRIFPRLIPTLRRRISAEVAHRIKVCDPPKCIYHKYEACLKANEKLIALLNEIEPRMDKITRFEVISSSGRMLVLYDVRVTLSNQDQGRTLKIFITHREPP
jgi:hypothetical protein